MSRTKTDQRTDREQYTRSSAATTRLLALVRPAETLARDWLNTNERQEMVMSTISLLNTIYRRNIKSTGSLRHVLRILETTINDLLSKAGITNLEQTPLNRSQQLQAPYKWLINGLKQNYRGTQRQFLENICSEDDLRSRIFGTFVVKFLACLPLLGFSNPPKMV